MWHAWGEVSPRRISVGKRKSRNHLDVIGIEGRMAFRGVLAKCGGEAWTGFIWLRIGTGGGVLCT